MLIFTEWSISKRLRKQSVQLRLLSSKQLYVSTSEFLSENDPSVVEMLVGARGFHNKSARIQICFYGNHGNPARVSDLRSE